MIQPMSMEMSGRRLTIVLALILAILTGCASSHGFDRSAIREALHIDPTTHQDSRPIMDPALDLGLPFRLGVFFAEHDFPNRPSIRKVEWLSADRDRLLRLLTPLQDERILADTFVLMDATLRADNIHRIRQAGSRYVADAVLIVEGAAAVDRYNNGYASLYPTLIGAHLAPGTESHALVTVTGSFLGVKSERHSPPQTVEGVSKLVGPALFVDDDIVVGQAKEAAIEALGKHIIDRLRLLKEELPPAKLRSR
jgi:hypothetical protein